MPTFNGTNDSDEIFGTVDGDIISGRAGDDYLYGREADDEILGGSGNDRIEGNAGADTIDAGDDNDWIYGDESYGETSSDGWDEIDGGLGDDYLFGGGGNDLLRGGGGNDGLRGGGGVDLLDGGDGDDHLDGTTDAASDLLIGGPGNDFFSVGFGDSVDGGAGTDSVFISYQSGTTAGVTLDFRALANGGNMVIGGGTISGIEYISGYDLTPFNDAVIAGPVGNISQVTISGWGGNDDLTGSAGADTLYGGDGDDILRGGVGINSAIYPSLDRLFGENGNDTIHIGADGALASGGRGDDRVYGGSSNDQISGDDGADWLSGGAGSDSLDGGLGNDVIDGGAGTDFISGREGNDVLNGGDGSDDVGGDAGNDRLSGGGSADILRGGAGYDTFVDTRSNLDLDKIMDFQPGDRIIFTDASLATFTFSLSGHLLHFPGGSIILEGLGAIPPTLVATAAPGGGVQIVYKDARLQEDAENDFNGDGRSDIVWRSDGGLMIDWLGLPTGGFHDNGASSFRALPTNWSIVGTGDFNGDGRDDLLLRHTSGISINWLGTATGGFTDNGSISFNSVSTSWEVAGVGDFNGDGRDDILWRHSSGITVNWLGSVTGSYFDNGFHSFKNVELAWAVAGIGDFNGDGRDDILWRHSDGRLMNSLATENGGFTDNGVNSSYSVPNGWKIAGTGDFNSDGRDDILWRHETGMVINWLGQVNGSFSDNGANSFQMVPTSWKVVAVGDYNGDGHDDILWRHENGMTVNWLGQVDGGYIDNGVKSFSHVSTNWQIQPEALF